VLGQLGGVKAVGVEVCGVVEPELLELVVVFRVGGIGQDPGELGAAPMPPQSSGGAARRPAVQRGNRRR